MLFDPFLSDAFTCVQLLRYASLSLDCANVRPARVRLYAMALETEDLWKTRAAPVRSTLGLDLSSFDRLMQVSTRFLFFAPPHSPNFVHLNTVHIALHCTVSVHITVTEQLTDANLHQLQEAERRADASLEPVAMCEYGARALSAKLLVDTLERDRSRWQSAGAAVSVSTGDAVPIPTTKSNHRIPNSDASAEESYDEGGERHETEEDDPTALSEPIFRKSLTLTCSEFAYTELLYLYCTVSIPL